MKKIAFKFAVAILAIVSITGCSKESDYETLPFNEVVYGDDFTYDSTKPNSLADRGYTIFNEAGTTKWKEEEYSGDAYAVLDAYQSPDVSIIAWLITPPINMDKHDGEKLLFQAAQAYVGSAANSLEVLVSSDFDGTNVLAATWTPVAFTQPTISFDTNFQYVNSNVDLSSYTGNIFVAFKVTGSGTNTALDGTYQIDNIRVTY